MASTASCWRLRDYRRALTISEDSVEESASLLWHAALSCPHDPDAADPNSATEAEVGHQLGHAPGSPMTRYAKFTFAAEQSIVNKAEQGLDSLLKPNAK